MIFATTREKLHPGKLARPPKGAKNLLKIRVMINSSPNRGEDTDDKGELNNDKDKTQILFTNPEPNPRLWNHSKGKMTKSCRWPIKQSVSEQYLPQMTKP